MTDTSKTCICLDSLTICLAFGSPALLSISRQVIAKHLAVLEDAGLVMSKRKEKYRVITFNNEPLKNLLKGGVEYFPRNEQDF